MSFITGRGATGPFAVQANGTFQTSTDANLSTLLGTRWDLSDGREVILASASAGTVTTAGQLYQDQATVANNQGLTVTAVQAYSSNGNVPATVTVTNGGTAVVANQYQGGFAFIDSGTGIGQSLKIASHPAAATSASFTITLEDGPTVALNTSSTVCLSFPHGSGVIQAPTTLTGAIVGAALYQIPASSYGFLVSKGITAVLSDSSAPPAGASISASQITAGACALSSGTTGVIGYAVQLGVSAKSRSVFLNV